MQKVRSRKSNKKQFQSINRDVFVTPDEAFEAFRGFHDDLVIDNTEYLYLIINSFLYLLLLQYFILLFRGLFAHLVLLFLNPVIKKS